MTTNELKLKIIETIEKMPETSLEEVLNYLDRMKNFSVEERRKFAIIDKIFKEDSTLLKKLAE